MAAERAARSPRAAFIGGRAPSAEDFERWIGWRVDDVNGSMIGHVEGVLPNERREPCWLVVSEFRLGDGRRFLIPVADAVAGGGRVWSLTGASTSA